MCGYEQVWGRPEEEAEQAPKPAVEVKPVLELSGKLAAETNKVWRVQLRHLPLFPCSYVDL